MFKTYQHTKHRAKHVFTGPPAVRSHFHLLVQLTCGGVTVTITKGSGSHLTNPSGKEAISERLLALLACISAVSKREEAELTEQGTWCQHGSLNLVRESLSVESGLLPQIVRIPQR